MTQDDERVDLLLLKEEIELLMESLLCQTIQGTIHIYFCDTLGLWSKNFVTENFTRSKEFASHLNSSKFLYHKNLELHVYVRLIFLFRLCILTYLSHRKISYQ